MTTPDTDDTGDEDTATTDSALRSVTKGAGVVLLGTVLQLGLAFVAKAVMARFLELSEYGFVSLGIIAINLGATVALVGLESGVARYLPRYDGDTPRRKAVYFSYVLSVGISVIVGAGIYLTAPTLSRLLFQDASLAPVLRVMAVGVPFWVLLDLGVGVTQGLSEALPRVYAKNVALPLTRFGLVAAAILLGFEGIGVAGAYVTSYALAAVLMTYLVIRRLPPTLPTLGSRETELVSFSVPLTFSNLSSLLYRNVDLVLVGFFWTAGEVAVYNVAYPFARLLLVGTGAFGFLFTPVVSGMHADGEMDEARRVYQVTTKWLLLMVAPPFALMALFPEVSITVLFGGKYREGALALVVLAVGFFLTNVTGLNMGVLTSIGRSRTVMVVDTVALALNLVLNLLLIPEYSYLGAAVATGATYLGRDFVASGILYRDTGIHPFTASLVRPLAFTAVAVAAIYVPVTLLLEATVPQLVGLFVLFVLVYAVGVLRFGGIEREDIMIFDAVEAEAGVDLTAVRRVVRRLMG